MFPMMGKVFDSYNAELLREADLFVVGRISFQLFNSFWPKVAESRDSDKWTAEQRELSEAGESVPMIVVSDTLTGSGQVSKPSGAQTRTRRLPNSSRSPAKTFSSLAAGPSGTICWRTIWSTRST
jgi:hypothetical protein